MADDNSARKPLPETGGQPNASTPSGTAQITVPRLLTSSISMWVAVGVSALAAIGIAAWGLATQQGTNRVLAALIAVLVLSFMAATAWRRTWIDRTKGTISQSVMGIRIRSVAWADATTIALEPNRAGQLALRISGDSTVRVTLLAVDLGGPRAMPPNTLRLLADEIATWTASRERVVAALQSQADFLADGGAVTGSPLARHI